MTDTQGTHKDINKVPLYSCRLYKSVHKRVQAQNKAFQRLNVQTVLFITETSGRV